MVLTPGDLLGPYRIEALLGSGGMGEVYRARDSRLGRDAALKVIAPRHLGDSSLRRRFELEARAASVLNHPAIVTIYDVGESDGISWIAMEWVEGQTLRQAMSEGTLPIEQVVTIGRQIAEGLAVAHAKGVVHRDLKPENVMLVDGRAKILDFGLARQNTVEGMERSPSQVMTLPVASGAATFEGAILGTVGYMSPEQASGRPVDFRSDQFAFGLLVYEMLAGRRAFVRSSTVETLAAIIREDPVPLSSIRRGIPDSLHHLIARCLAKTPDGRFSSTREIVSALESIAAGVSVKWVPAADAETVARIADPIARPMMTFSRRSVVAMVATSLLLLVLGAAAWRHFNDSPKAIDSLAVLPFENATRDPSSDYLGDGMTESLIDQMSRVPTLRVMARSTVARFRRADPAGAGRQLGVGAVLVGSISRRSGDVVISAELVESATGARLWGQTYDRPATDLLRVQDSIALEIVDGLRVRLSPQDKERFTAHGTRNAEAYELFLKARFLLQQDTEEDDLEALRLYLQALEKDPAFVDAYHGAATVHVRSAGNGYAPPAEAWRRATEYSRKTLELDPGNFGARLSLASRHFFYDWDWSLVERESHELSTDPRLFARLSYHGAAMFYWATGRPEQSVAIMEKGLQADPTNVESRIMLADFLAEAGRVVDSIAHYKAIIAAKPADASSALFGLANVQRRRGDIAAAIATLREAYQVAGEQTGVETLANAKTENDYDQAEIAMARDRLAQLEDLARQRYVSPADLARLQAKVGNRDQAFATLELALAERSSSLVFLKVDRAWDPIRKDPRFADVVRRVGIP